MHGNGITSKVVHCKKEKYDVYIGRPSIWGNPFSIGKDGTREEVLQKYASWIKTQDLPFDNLRGKTLGCWCHPLSCHGDILMALANSQDFYDYPFKEGYCRWIEDGVCYYIRDEDMYPTSDTVRYKIEEIE